MNIYFFRQTINGGSKQDPYALYLKLVKLDFEEEVRDCGMK